MKNLFTLLLLIVLSYNVDAQVKNVRVTKAQFKIDSVNRFYRTAIREFMELGFKFDGKIDQSRVYSYEKGNWIYQVYISKKRKKVMLEGYAFNSSKYFLDEDAGINEIKLIFKSVKQRATTGIPYNQLQLWNWSRNKNIRVLY